MENEKKYITFALPMIRKLFCHAQTAINDMVIYGAYRTGKQMKVDYFNGHKQLLWYAFSENLNHQLPRDLMQLVVDWVEGADPTDMKSDYMAKDGSGIDDEEVDEFIKYKGDKKNDVIKEWYQFVQSKSVLGIVIPNIPNSIETGRKYFEIYGSGQIPVSVSPVLLFRFRDSMRTEYDRVRCALYLAIRSLSGNDVAVTTSQAILWRMMGCRNKHELDEVIRDKKMKAIWQKYATRYYYRLMMDDLITSGLVRQISYHRHTCVTASVMDESKFIESVATKIRRMQNNTKRAKVKGEQRRLSDMLKDQINSC